MISMRLLLLMCLIGVVKTNHCAGALIIRIVSLLRTHVVEQTIQDVLRFRLV